MAKLCLGVFNNERNYIDSVLEDRLGSIGVNVGQPKEGVPGKMMSTCTDIGGRKEEKPMTLVLFSEVK